LLAGAPNRAAAADHTPPTRHRQLVDDFPQLVAILALDAPRDAAATRIVRHEHEVTACHTDEGRECRSLVAPLVLVYLDDELLAFLDGVLDAGSADVHARLEVGACD